MIHRWMGLEPRFVRIGPAKKSHYVERSETDGGITYYSDYEDKRDEELVDFLKSNGHFLTQLCNTSGFSVPVLHLIQKYVQSLHPSLWVNTIFLSHH